MEQNNGKLGVVKGPFRSRMFVYQWCGRTECDVVCTRCETIVLDPSKGCQHCQVKEEKQRAHLLSFLESRKMLSLLIVGCLALAGCTATLHTKDCAAEIHYFPGQEQSIEAGDCRLSVD